jgi:hypothetical protein
MWKSLSIVAAILTAGAAFFSYQNVQQFKNERLLLAIAKANQIEAEKHLAEVKSTLADNIDGRKKTESERDAIETETVGLKPKIEAVEEDIKERESERDTVTARWTEVKKQVDESGGIDQLKSQLISLTSQRGSLESEVAAIKGRTTAATNRFTSLEQQIADLRRKETWQARGIIQDGFRASIVQVDRDYGFITLSAGNNRGVVSGATLDIKRGGSVVGQAKVTNVEQSYSIADLVGVRATDIQVGDSVSVTATSSSRSWVQSEQAAPATTAKPAATSPTDAAPAPAPDAPATPSEPLDPFAPAENPATVTPSEPTPAPPAEAPVDPFAN